MPATVSEITVDALYRAILGRSADPSGLASFTEVLDRGGSAEEIVRALRDSDEFKSGLAQPNADGGHPLARFADSYDERDVSYFMHRGRFRPLTISVETINICNNDCVICPYSSQTRARRTMPMDLFRKLIDDYTEIGGGPISLTPLVGEVFLDKLLLDRLMVLKEARAITSVSATTNAIMVRRFDEDHLRALLSNFDRVKVSVYGLDRDEYLAMTRRDEYALFRRNLVRMLSAAEPGSVVLGIRSLRSRTEDEIGAWSDDLARDAGLATVEIASSTRTFANWSFFDTSKPLPMAGQWLPVRQNRTQCGIPLLGAQILVDGRVSFCACANFDGTSELIVGDLHEQSLAEMLDSEAVSSLWDWETSGVPEFCKTCSFHTPLDAVARHKWVYRDPIRFIGG